MINKITNDQLGITDRTTTMDDEHIFTKGDNVLYKNNDGKKTRAKITVVTMHPDEPPSYTIVFSNGQERETISKKLEIENSKKKKIQKKKK